MKSAWTDAAKQLVHGTYFVPQSPKYLAIFILIFLALPFRAGRTVEGQTSAVSPNAGVDAAKGFRIPPLIHEGLLPHT